MEKENAKHGHEQCQNDETAQRLVEEGKQLKAEGHRLEEEARRLFEQGEHLEEEGNRLERESHEQKEKDLFIFVNRIRLGEKQGVKHVMTDDELAGLVGLTNQTAIVRRLLNGDDTSEPLSGPQKIKRGDQFVVTRRAVEGGFQDRVEREVALLQESSQVVEFVRGSTSYVIYRGVPTKSRTKTDVIVAVPTGYPAAMIDRAGLPEGSMVIGQVRGSPQEVIQVAGQNWRMISYHPHAGGGGLSWNPAVHGFHTYLSEIFAWLEVGK